MSKTHTLVIVYGQVRTLRLTALSIYHKILAPNHPYHVLLAIDGGFDDIPPNVLKLFGPRLIDVYTTRFETEDEDDHDQQQQQRRLPRDHNRIEFALVHNALTRLTPAQKERYLFMIKVRTDLYIREPIDLHGIYCIRSIPEFRAAWQRFKDTPKIKALSTTTEQMQAWFLTGGGIKFFASRYSDTHRPVSPWSLSNTVDWNQKLWDQLSTYHNTPVNQQRLLREIGRRVVYLIGSTWLHFGYFEIMEDLVRDIFLGHGTYLWPGKANDDLLQWTDHKGIVRSKPQSEWKWITDDQLRLCHTLHHGNDCFLIDLVNPEDYIESFDATHSLKENIANPGLFGFIVREHTIPPPPP